MGSKIKQAEPVKWSFNPLAKPGFQSFMFQVLEEHDFHMRFGGLQKQAAFLSRVGFEEYLDLSTSDGQKKFVESFLPKVKELYKLVGLDPSLLDGYSVIFFENPLAGDMAVHSFKKELGVNLSSLPERAAQEQMPGMVLSDEQYKTLQQSYLAKLFVTLVHEGSHMEFHGLHSSHVEEYGDFSFEDKKELVNVFAVALQEPSSKAAQALQVLAFDEARAGVYESSTALVEGALRFSVSSEQSSDVFSVLCAQGRTFDELEKGVSLKRIELPAIDVSFPLPTEVFMTFEVGSVFSHCYNLLGQWYAARLDLKGLNPLDVFRKLSAPDGLMPFFTFDGKLGFYDYESEGVKVDAAKVVDSLFNEKEAKEVKRIML